MEEKRRKFSPEEKVRILHRHLTELCQFRNRRNFFCAPCKIPTFSAYIQLKQRIRTPMPTARAATRRVTTAALVMPQSSPSSR